MRILFFEMLKQKVRASRVNLVCVFIFAMLTCGCAGEYKKETSMAPPASPSPTGVSVSHANETGQVSGKGESVNGETSDDQEIECRRMASAGSRIPKKICGTKEQWALWSKKTGENAKGFIRDANEGSRSDTTDAWAPVAPTPGMPMP